MHVDRIRSGVRGYRNAGKDRSEAMQALIRRELGRAFGGSKEHTVSWICRAVQLAGSRPWRRSVRRRGGARAPGGCQGVASGGVRSADLGAERVRHMRVSQARLGLACRPLLHPSLSSPHSHTRSASQPTHTPHTSLTTFSLFSRNEGPQHRPAGLVLARSRLCSRDCRHGRGRRRQYQYRV